GKVAWLALGVDWLAPASGTWPTAAQSGRTRLSSPWQPRWPRPGDAAHRQHQGPSAQAPGGEADAGLERRGAEQQARTSVLSPIDVLRARSRGTGSASKNTARRQTGAPDVAQARETWKDDQASLDASKLIFIDETGTNTKMVRTRGRCHRSRRLIGKARW